MLARGMKDTEKLAKMTGVFEAKGVICGVTVANGTVYVRVKLSLAPEKAAILYDFQKAFGREVSYSKDHSANHWILGKRWLLKGFYKALEPYIEKGSPTLELLRSLLFEPIKGDTHAEARFRLEQLKEKIKEMYRQAEVE
jgi:hypothetical protein